jgi:hypothetical protein
MLRKTCCLPRVCGYDKFPVSGFESSLTPRVKMFRNHNRKDIEGFPVRRCIVFLMSQASPHVWKASATFLDQAQARLQIFAASRPAGDHPTSEVPFASLPG